MAGTAWPTLVPLSRADATQVEQKFEWMQGNIVPMQSGLRSDNNYDLGTSTHRWRDAYVSRQLLNGNVGTLGTPATARTGASTGLNLSPDALTVVGGATDTQRIISKGVIEPTSESFVLTSTSPWTHAQSEGMTKSPITFSLAVMHNNNATIYTPSFSPVGITTKMTGHYFFYFLFYVLIFDPSPDPRYLHIYLNSTDNLMARVQGPGSRIVAPMSISGSIIRYFTAGTNISLGSFYPYTFFESEWGITYRYNSTRGYFGGYFLG